MLHFPAGENRQTLRSRLLIIALRAWQSSCNRIPGHASPWMYDLKRITMKRKQAKYRQIIWLERRTRRPLTESPEPSQLQPLVTIPGINPLPETADTMLPPYARRRYRAWIVPNFDVRRVLRLIPIKSDNFQLRCRNLSYKRKWNLVWC